MLCQMVTCGGTCKQVFVDYGSFRLGKGNHPSTGGLLTGLATLNKSPISSLVVRGLDAGDVQSQDLLSSFLIAFGDRLTSVDVSTCFLLHSHLQQLGYCKNLRSFTFTYYPVPVHVPLGSIFPIPLDSAEHIPGVETSQCLSHNCKSRDNSCSVEHSLRIDGCPQPAPARDGSLRSGHRLSSSQLLHRQRRQRVSVNHLASPHFL